MEQPKSILIIFQTIILFVFCLCPLIVAQTKNEKPKYLDNKIPINDRIKDLLGRMTLEEKVAQLQCTLEDVEENDMIKENGLGNLGCILRSSTAEKAAEKANRLQKMSKDKTRLGIPFMIHDECLHGLIGNGATSFPQAIGLAAAWNPELMEKIGTAIGRETRSRGIHQALSPVINIARDVRWGRVEETYGEDPYLTARMGVAFCRSMEKEGVITTPKHYAANVGDGGRDSYPIHFNERLLREIYFPAFKACFQEAGAQSVMASYNSLDGIPCSANRWLLTNVLRDEWGFDGFVVSDYGSVFGIKEKHHTAGTSKEAAKQAIEAGLDIELPSIEFYSELVSAVKEGLVSEKTIDIAVSRILKAKFKLGLFENSNVDPKKAAEINNLKEHRQLALYAAREAIVLLKNDKDFLPLNKNLKNITVIGPEATTPRLGGYSGFGMKIVSILEGIKNKVTPGVTVNYAKGFESEKHALPAIPEEFLLAVTGKGEVKGLKGEYFNNMELSGEPVLTRIDKQINFDWGAGSPDEKIHSNKFSIRWTGKLIPKETGNYNIGVTTDDGVRLYVDGKLMIDSWVDRGASTDIITMKLESGKKYDIKIEYYENGGSASALLGWDSKLKTEENLFSEAIEIAKKSDVAIFVADIKEGEGGDRSSLDLPGNQEELIKAISETGKPVVVVLINGSAITMKNWINEVPSILEAWYPGEEGGNAIADVLFGDFNPGGKLPITFPISVGQVPLYYNHKPTGRGDDYIDLTGKPLFPFGYGLSYTKFEYTNLKISQEKVKLKNKTEIQEPVTIQFDIKNTGKYKGDEVVQLYIHDLVGSTIRPVKELRNFKRITLEPGEKKAFSFTIVPDDLSMYDKDMKWIIEPGDFEIMLGSSSEDIRLKGNLEVIE